MLCCSQSCIQTQYSDEMVQQYKNDIKDRMLKMSENANLTSLNFISSFDIDTLLIENCPNTQLDVQSCKITELHILDCELQFATGLHLFPNLTILILTQNKLLQINELSTLTFLSKLDLSFNVITDISPLQSLKNLKYLNLTANQTLTNICPLQELTQLTILNLQQINLENASVLSTLIQLQELDLGYNKLVSLSGLQNMNQLQKLNLASNLLQDISILSTLNLKELNISQNPDIDLQPLLYMVDLKVLYVCDNALSGNAAIYLRNLVQLENLQMSCNQIVDVYPLRKLTKLKALDMFMNEIIDTTPLKELQLQSLNLQFNYVQSFELIKAHEHWNQQDQQQPTPRQLFISKSIQIIHGFTDQIAIINKKHTEFDERIIKKQKTTHQLINNSLNRHEVFINSVARLLQQGNDNNQQ
ncbi:leucine-rich_repeat domain-containing protein [Hexamita inflata]|uniref:Leucine-rich_repeat domain-containing protein n=1 Tax=Hexamita inflata TaxID=28002 RepID=A0ABP1K275_9EUKA